MNAYYVPYPLYVEYGIPMFIVFSLSWHYNDNMTAFVRVRIYPPRHNKIALICISLSL